MICLELSHTNDLNSIASLMRRPRMQRPLAIFLYLTASVCSSLSYAEDPQPLVPRALRCEDAHQPLGIDNPHPQLSWEIHPGDPALRDVRQRAYRILVASTLEKLANNVGDLWDSGRVDSHQSMHVPYSGTPLQSHQPCYWKVKVWATHAEHDSKPIGKWSEAAYWSTGPLERKAWGDATWIGGAAPPTFEYSIDSYAEGWKQATPSPLFRKRFQVDKPFKRVTVNICGLGYHELRLNGRKVGTNQLDPAFTRYDRRVLYVTHDVTEQVQAGDNAVGVMLGNGWYNMHTRATWDFDKAPWRDEPVLLLQIRIEYADGQIEAIGSDKSWRTAFGPIRLDSVRAGEVYDARHELDGWDTASFDDSHWQESKVASGPSGKLVAQSMPPMRVTETIRPKAVMEPQPGVFVLDLGQNIAGWAQIEVDAPAGSAIKLRYAELLHDNGMIDQSNINNFVFSGPFQQDTYITSGAGPRKWQPRFSYHGFRYIEVTGWPGKPTLDNISGKVVHTDFESAGSFECSDELINKIQQLALWSYRGNFHGYPTDCPHREKNGWTGDAHLAAHAGLYNFRSASSYRKWLDDLRDAQTESGGLPNIVPTSGWGYGDNPAWDIALVLIPWELYVKTGDKQPLVENFDAMRRYVDRMKRRAPGLIVDWGLGDWVPYRTKTPRSVTSTAYFYRGAHIVAQTAEILGHSEAADHYQQLAERIRQAFNREFYQGDGFYSNASQTALACALYQSLVDADQEPLVVEQLTSNVRSQDNHLDVGILGAKYLFNTLSEHGHHDLALEVVRQRTLPGYGYWVEQGATTMWEHWDGSSSRNHIMFGDISAWFYRHLAGIRPVESHPGFRHFRIEPKVNGDLEWVDAHYQSPYGKIRSSWRRDECGFRLNASVPPNTTAMILLPASDAMAIREAGNPLVDSLGIRGVTQLADSVKIEVGSGDYAFMVPKDGDAL